MSRAGSAIVATRVRLAGGLRRVPRAAWLCALVALANGLAWSLIVPPFEVPDENAHYAYVQQIAERGTLPHHVLPEGLLSPAEDATLGALGFYEIVGQAHNPSPFSEFQQQAIETVGHQALATKGDGDALSATNNPPLYYFMAAVPYKIGSGGTVLDRVALMRLLSVLLGAVTVLLVYLFLKEALPGEPWAWTAGALVAAFQPLFAFISAGVNNDNLLFLMSAGMLWSIARVFRRGLSRSSGLMLGASVGLGTITKLTMLGLIPAAALAVLLVARRQWHDQRRQASVGAAWALAVAAAPVLAYYILNRLVWNHGVVPVGIGSVSSPTSAIHFSFREEVSHIWQLFVVPIGMHHQFGYVPLWDTWFKGFIGRLGWLDYLFPGWFYYAAAGVTFLVLGAAAGELVRRRRTLVKRLGELSVYVLALLGLCVEIGVQSYRLYVQTDGSGRFEQARYLLPVLCLYAAIVALAARFAGPRWGPAIAAGLVMLAIGHDLYAQLITIGRYYT
jgi:hypothetical protein